MVQGQQFEIETTYDLKFYIIVAKGWKLKVRKFLGPIPTVVEVTGEKQKTGRVGRGLFAPPSHAE